MCLGQAQPHSAQAGVSAALEETGRMDAFSGPGTWLLCPDLVYPSQWEGIVLVRVGDLRCREAQG